MHLCKQSSSWKDVLNIEQSSSLMMCSILSCLAGGRMCSIMSILVGGRIYSILSRLAVERCAQYWAVQKWKDVHNIEQSNSLRMCSILSSLAGGRMHSILSTSLGTHSVLNIEQSSGWQDVFNIEHILGNTSKQIQPKQIPNKKLDYLTNQFPQEDWVKREAAILQALNKNHHIAILGIKLIKPLLTKRLCLPNRS